MADYDQAIKLNPNYAFAFNTRGSVKQVLQVDAASYRNILLHHLPGETLRRTTRGQATNLNPQHGSTRDPLAGITFPEDVIEARLALLDLPRTTSLSVLAVEVLPGPLNFPANLKNNAGGQEAVASTQEDPVGANLGLRRILRTSPLTAVPAIC